MTRPVALVTGFEPYGERARNPAGEVAARLHGTEIAGVRVIGRNFPVAFGPLENLVPATLAEVDPAVSVEGMRRVIHEPAAYPSGCFYDYRGQSLAW